MIMNSFYKSLITVFSLALLAFACQENNNNNEEETAAVSGLSIDETDRKLSFGPEGGSLLIAVKASGEYTATVESGQNWCTVSDVTATDFKITVVENTAVARRTAKITVSLSGYPGIEIEVTQLGLEPALIIHDEYKALLFSLSGGDTVIAVTSNGEYSVTVEDGKEWCTVSNVTATNFKISVAANAGFEMRGARVTVSLAKTPGVDIIVTQEQTPLLAVGEEDRVQQFEVSGGSKTIAVTANDAFTVRVEDGKEWCAVSDTAKTDFKISVTSNPASEERTARITLSLAGAQDIEIVVTQAAASLIVSVEPDRLRFNSGFAGEQTVTVSSNGPEFIFTADVDQSWVTTETVDGTLKVKVALNPNSTAINKRTAKITVRVTGADDVEVEVIQDSCLNKSLMSAHYVGDDNRTTFANNQTMTSLFDNISLGYGSNQHNIYCTAPNTDGTTDVPPKEGSVAWEFPFYFTMDLGVEVYLNSFRTTPRSNTTARKWEYRLGSPYRFEVWGTNADKADVPADDPYWQETWKTDWLYMGEFTCHNPSGLTPSTITGLGDISAADCHFAAAGYNFETLPTTAPVRYLRFKINEVWEPGVTYVHIQEIWFWGDVVN
jgi:hypothetical protein